MIRECRDCKGTGRYESLYLNEECRGCKGKGTIEVIFAPNEPDSAYPDVVTIIEEALANEHICTGDPVFVCSATSAWPKKVGRALTRDNDVYGVNLHDRSGPRDRSTKIVREGIACVLLNARHGDTYWLAEGGGLVTHPPTRRGSHCIQIGRAVSPVDLRVSIKSFGPVT